MKNNELIAQWMIESINAVTLTVRDENISIFKDFYVKWYHKGIYDIDPADLPDDHVLMASIMKMAIAMRHISRPIKNKAVKWLTDNGFSKEIKL